MTGRISSRTVRAEAGFYSLPGPEDEATLGVLISALRMRDAQTYEHSERTVRLSLRLGPAHGLDPSQMSALWLGSLLHDIGKIGVPDCILHKPGRLTDEEWMTMRRHPGDGQQLLSGLPFLADAARVVAQHHERWDGTGYPAGLRGEEIDRAARVLTVADAFDVMTHERDYCVARTEKEAMDELDRCAGKQFDPGVVETFHRVLADGPPLAIGRGARLA